VYLLMVKFNLETPTIPLQSVSQYSLIPKWSTVFQATRSEISHTSMRWLLLVSFNLWKNKLKTLKKPSINHKTKTLIKIPSVQLNSTWTNSIMILHQTLPLKETFKLNNWNLWPGKSLNSICIKLLDVKYKLLSNFFKLTILTQQQLFWIKSCKDRLQVKDNEMHMKKLLKWQASWWDRSLQSKKLSIKRCKEINKC